MRIQTDPSFGKPHRSAHGHRSKKSGKAKPPKVLQTLPNINVIQGDDRAGTSSQEVKASESLGTSSQRMRAIYKEARQLYSSGLFDDGALRPRNAGSQLRRGLSAIHSATSKVMKGGRALDVILESFRMHSEALAMRQIDQAREEIKEGAQWSDIQESLTKIVKSLFPKQEDAEDAKAILDLLQQANEQVGDLELALAAMKERTKNAADTYEMLLENLKLSAVQVDLSEWLRPVPRKKRRSLRDANSGTGGSPGESVGGASPIPDAGDASPLRSRRSSRRLSGGDVSPLRSRRSSRRLSGGLAGLSGVEDDAGPLRSRRSSRRHSGGLAGLSGVEDGASPLRSRRSSRRGSDIDKLNALTMGVVDHYGDQLRSTVHSIQLLISAKLACLKFRKRRKSSASSSMDAAPGPDEDPTSALSEEVSPQFAEMFPNTGDASKALEEVGTVLADSFNQVLADSVEKTIGYTRARLKWRSGLTKLQARAVFAKGYARASTLPSSTAWDESGSSSCSESDSEGSSYSSASEENEEAEVPIEPEGPKPPKSSAQGIRGKVPLTMSTLRRRSWKNLRCDVALHAKAGRGPEGVLMQRRRMAIAARSPNNNPLPAAGSELGVSCTSVYPSVASGEQSGGDALGPPRAFWRRLDLPEWRREGLEDATEQAPKVKTPASWIPRRRMKTPFVVDEWRPLTVSPVTSQGYQPWRQKLRM